jgi:hypothetical protein
MQSLLKVFTTQHINRYFELSESRGYINFNQKNYGLSNISNTEQANQLPIDHKYYHDVYDKSMSPRPTDNRPKRYKGQLLQQYQTYFSFNFNNKIFQFRIN